MKLSHAQAAHVVRQQALQVVMRHLKFGEQVAFLDYPRHQNAGDSLIWRGTLDILNELNAEIRYHASLHLFSAAQLRKRLPAGSLVLLNGGGNLGDRWRDIQKFRENVITELHDYRILQMPQSLEFESTEAIDRAREVFTSHPDLTLLLRDDKAFARAKALFPGVKGEFCPDMAFGNRSLPPATQQPTGAPVDILWLKRTDSEAVEHRSTQEWTARQELDVMIADWGLDGWRGRVQWRALRFPEDVTRVIPGVYTATYPTIKRTFYTIAELNVGKATKILSQGTVVLTDRLHAMVLAALMGKSVVGYNNANGKVGDIYDSYLHSFENVQFRKDELDAGNLAAELVREMG